MIIAGIDGETKKILRKILIDVIIIGICEYINVIA